ncbi:MAG TPA: extracellular solute-binding protein [Ktedonobacterales bacterium]
MLSRLSTGWGQASRFKIAGLLIVLTMLLVPLTACGGGGSSNGPVTLTFWSWVPNLQDEVKLFEQAHPNIHVKLVNAGQGNPEYTKLRNALKAGTGAPDVVQIEFQYLPTFELQKALVDLAPYGATSLKNDYVPWTWGQVSNGSSVYAIPQDSGPMGLLYRKDIFDKYNLQVPTTWDQFAQVAQQLHQADPSISMTTFEGTDGGWLQGLEWQAGSHPFTVNGTNLTVSLNDAPAQKVFNYWGNLVNKKLVATTPDFTNDWYAAFNNGKYATWITAAWGPVFLSGFADKTSGKWRAAPLPQWNAGDTASANWGGSSDAVTTQSKHPKEAYELASWINHDKSSAMMLATKQFLFPTVNSVLSDPSFAGGKLDFYGGQQVNQVFIESSQHVNTNFQWSPFQDYVYTQMGDVVGSAQSGKMSFSDALNQLQATVVTYGKQQGFNVTS